MTGGNTQEIRIDVATGADTTGFKPAVGSRKIFFSPRIRLVGISTIRVLRGCDAESVLDCVGDATHPKFLRWVFNLAVKPDGIRELRFWRDEISGVEDTDAALEIVIEKILGQRRNFPRSEIEIQWGINATTISRLIRAGEIAETEQGLTHDSLAGFLKRRLQ